jgi:hypothetical protein
MLRLSRFMPPKRSDMNVVASLSFAICKVQLNIDISL